MARLLNLPKWIPGVIRETNELRDQERGSGFLVLNFLGEREQTLWNLVTDVSDCLKRSDASDKLQLGLGKLLFLQSTRR